jgi:hypothetical protein
MVRKFEGWNVVYMYYTFFVHSKEVQLISDNNPVHSGFVYYNTNCITAYLFVFRWTGSIIQQKPCRILCNMWLIGDALWNSMTGTHSYSSIVRPFLHSQHIIIFVLIKNHLELYWSRSTAILWKRNSDCLRHE